MIVNFSFLCHFSISLLVFITLESIERLSEILEKFRNPIWQIQDGDCGEPMTYLPRDISIRTMTAAK